MDKIDIFMGRMEESLICVLGNVIHYVFNVVHITYCFLSSRSVLGC